MFYLDTNVIVDASRKKTAEQIKKHFKGVKPNKICIPSIVIAELEFGALHSNDYENNMKIISKIIAPYKIIPFTEKEAVAYGIIREQLTKDGQVIGPNDMLIAATALANGATVVTHNTDEFSRVKNLPLEDWREDNN